MSVEQNKELMARYFKQSNAIRGDVAAKISALSAKYTDPSCVYHFAAGDMNLDQCSQFFAGYFKAFPDMTYAVEDMVAEADKVLIRHTWQGTQKGEWMGAAPTGKKFRQIGMTIYRLAGGKIVETWTVNEPMVEAKAGPSLSPKK